MQKQKLTQEEHLAAARHIARQHGMFVVPRGDTLLLYRQTGSPRSALLGRCKNAVAIHSLVKRCAKTEQ